MVNGDYIREVIDDNEELIHTYYIVKQIIYREDFNSDTSKQVDYIRYPTETIIDAEGVAKTKLRYSLR